MFLSRVPMKIVSPQLVSGPKEVESVLTLTNATPMTENVMSMLIASIM